MFSFRLFCNCLIDEEIWGVLASAQKRATDILTDLRKALQSLADHLLEHETLMVEEIEALLN